MHRFDAAAGPLPARSLRSSSHHFGVADAIELARALGRLPPALRVYAIEGEDFGAGRALSPAVAQAVDAVAAELAAPTRRPKSSAPLSPVVVVWRAMHALIAIGFLASIGYVSVVRDHWPARSAPPTVDRGVDR